MNSDIADILEIFVETSYVHSHTIERRRYRQVLRERNKREAMREYRRLKYYADKFLRRRYYIEPLPPVCACVACHKTFNHSRALISHRIHCVNHHD